MKRLYAVAVAIGLAGVALLAGATVVAHHDTQTASVGRPDLDRAADRGGGVWGANYFPNVPLVTQDGERVHFYDLIKDKVVTISFMYTTCPDTCPVETARLLQVARLLGDRLGKDVFFYSITIDPEHDTQKVLKAYTDNWAIPKGWTFLTGEKKDIIHLRKRLGMRLDDVQSGDLADHTVNLLVGNEAKGLWMKRAPFENPYYLATQLGSWLQGFKLADDKSRSYAKAPELRQISDGEYVFRTHCSACHTVGGGEVTNPAGRHLGPDLYGVTDRRDRKWLERWLAEPDAVLREKDPQAMALYERYDRFPMPNLRLTDKDVTMLLGYIQQASQEIRDRRSGKMAEHMKHMQHGGQPGPEPEMGEMTPDRMGGKVDHGDTAH